MPAHHTIPQTPFALLSGSAQWGLAFPDDLEEPGVRILDRGLAFELRGHPSVSRMRSTARSTV